MAALLGALHCQSPRISPGENFATFLKDEFTCFSSYLGIRSSGGGSPKGLVHNLLMQFFTLDSSEIEVLETCFFDIVIT